MITFPDLKKWLVENDQEADMKRHDVKGKKKTPSSPPKLKKKNADSRKRRKRI